MGVDNVFLCVCVCTCVCKNRNTSRLNDRRGSKMVSFLRAFSKRSTNSMTQLHQSKPRRTFTRMKPGWTPRQSRSLQSARRHPSTKKQNKQRMMRRIRPISTFNQAVIKSHKRRKGDEPEPPLFKRFLLTRRWRKVTRLACFKGGKAQEGLLIQFPCWSGCGCSDHKQV